MLGNQISGILISKKTLSLSINGHHIIISEMENPISILQFSARQAITMTGCISPFILVFLISSVPLHSLKFIAALQFAAGKTNRAPLLLRHNLKAGHGIGKPTKKVIDEACERFAFMMIATGTAFVPTTRVSRCGTM